jgi:hypothetical protein
VVVAGALLVVGAGVGGAVQRASLPVLRLERAARQHRGGVREAAVIVLNVAREPNIGRGDHARVHGASS